MKNKHFKYCFLKTLPSFCTGELYLRVFTKALLKQEILLSFMLSFANDAKKNIWDNQAFQ